MWNTRYSDHVVVVVIVAEMVKRGFVDEVQKA